MRDRARLIEVLRTGNADVLGWHIVLAMEHAAAFLFLGKPFLGRYRRLLRAMARSHPSPHIRELAGEALWYEWISRAPRRSVFRAFYG